MNYKYESGKVDIRLPLFSAIVLILLLAFIGFRFKAAKPGLENRVQNMAKMQEVLSRMRINLIKSVDIEKASVMANTDEMSRTLAEESLRTAEAVEHDRLELSRLVEHDHIEKEASLLREFNSCWADLRKIDEVLLDFAVENSNIKASALSFAQGSQAMERYNRSLSEIIEKSSSSPQYTQILILACHALTAGYRVHYLHAPHIAAANDEEMDKIEAEIRQLDEVIESSLKEMERFLPKENQSLLHEAESAYAEFEQVTARVLQLSRQNTNIKSFELSLGRKRKVTAQCDEILGSLQADVRGRTFEATR